MVVYTFRTFPDIQQLTELSSNVFVFSKLKEDLIALTKRLDKEHPDYLVGIAATQGLSRIEPIAINKFNSGTVVSGGVSELELFVPDDSPFPIAASPTYTFCNWTMYQLQKTISDNSYNTKLVFLHINAKNLQATTSYLNKISTN